MTSLPVVKIFASLLTVFIIIIAFAGCSQSGNNAYITLFGNVEKQWNEPGAAPTLLSGELQSVLSTTRWRKDMNYPGFDSARRDLEKWISDARAIQCEDKGLQESRNYLLLALNSINLLFDEFEQTVYQRMMSNEKLPPEYVEQRAQEIDATEKVSSDAFDSANRLLGDYIQKHKP